jgi:hypothetical protein
MCKQAVSHKPQVAGCGMQHENDRMRGFGNVLSNFIFVHG